MLVDQFCALRIATPDDCACAATALKPLICSRIASTSSGLNEGGLSPPPPGPMRWPGRTISRLDPRLEICSFTAAVAPLPSVPMVATAATPQHGRASRRERGCQYG